MLPSISHLTDELVLLPVPKRSRRASSASVYTLSLPSGNERTPKDALRSLYLSLKPPLTETAVTDAIQFLQQQELSHGSYSSHIVSVDAEERSIYEAIVGKLAAAVYARTLDIFLREAGDAETEAEWWADIERSRSRAAYYLLQTFPSRMVNLVLDVKHALRSQQRNFDISMLSTSSLAQILTREGDSDNTIAASIFPHLRTHPYGIPFPPALLQFPALSIRSTPRILDHCRSAVFDFLSSISAIITFPVELARQECTFKRKELQKIRDERAEILGTLTLRREYLFGALREGEIKGSRLNSFIENINQLIVGQSYERLPADVEPSQLLATTVHVALPSHITSHQRSLQEHDLTRPGQIALLWPRLVLLPPLVLFSVHRMLASKDTLQTFAYDGADTIKRFCHGWLVEPLKDIIRTVRAGHERGVIVQKESIDADLKSLERMAVDLARDKLHYDEEQLVSFSHSIRKGDLTPILEIYEADIKNPVKSAISGTLLRSLFIQIQKAKVDIDHTLTGIDKLLKSQELTFAFVGVAPALAIVYIAGGVLAGLWRGGKGRGRYGSKRQRAAAWLAIRRTERLLVSKPTSEDYLSSKGSTIPPLTSGLLLLSVSSLRTYGERNLPQHSRLREGFLEDVGDLEDPSLDRDEKVKVVERMWRSWGDTLGWRRGGGSIVIA